MSDADDTVDELDAIRQRKRERLEAQLEGGSAPGNGQVGEAEASGGTPNEPIHVDGAEHFREILAGNDLVLVDFYADWCGPCQMLAPIVEELAAESPAAVAKVDSDVHQGLAGQYGVQGLPTLLLFEAGEPVERVMGVQQKGALADLIQRHA